MDIDNSRGYLGNNISAVQNHKYGAVLKLHLVDGMLPLITQVSTCPALIAPL
jgi:hypothetical protein